MTQITERIPEHVIEIGREEIARARRILEGKSPVPPPPNEYPDVDHETGEMF
jgi:hypothetical protein